MENLVNLNIHMCRTSPSSHICHKVQAVEGGDGGTLMRRTARGDSRRRRIEALDCVIPAERPQFTLREFAMLQEIDTWWWCTYRRAQNLESPTTQRRQKCGHTICGSRKLYIATAIQSRT
jgi:hypothetical protein